MGKYLDMLRERELSEEREKRYNESCTDCTKHNQNNALFRKLRLFRTLQEIESRCPAHVPPAAWKAAVEDGKRFLHEWGSQAEELGWTERDLLGLPEPPAKPSWRYNRLARKDCLGLIWLLGGRAVRALTGDSAAICSPGTGAVTIFRRRKT
jgi:hypothetical protein